MRTLALILCLLTGSQDSIGPRVELEGAGGTIQHLPLKDLTLTDPREAGAVFLRFLGLPLPAGERPGLSLNLKLASGGGFAAHLIGGQEERLELALRGGSRISLGIENLESLEFPEALDGQTGLPVAPEEGDRLYLVRGRGLDRLDGLVLGFSSQGIQFEGPLGERLHPWKEVGALFIEALEVPGDGDEAPDKETSSATITTSEGGALRAELLNVTGAGVKLRLGQDTLLLLPQDVAELAMADPSYTFLSDLPPSDLGPLNPFDTEEVVGQSWPPRSNQAVGGGPLRVGGRVFYSGLGVHAPSRVKWQLNGAWNRLRTSFGVDDSAGRGERGGTVRFRILVDGEVRFESGEVRVGSAASVAPVVDLVGAKELVLEVDPLDNWVLDRADWLRPILLRE